jgi:integrase/recombinase XerD
MLKVHQFSSILDMFSESLVYIWYTEAENYPSHLRRRGMATKYKEKRTGIWHIKYKDVDGKWKSKGCGKSASATDAETIRKKYDSEELNRRHHQTIRIIDGVLLDSLEDYKKNEIDKAVAGDSKAKETIRRYKNVIDNFAVWCQNNDHKKFGHLNQEVVKKYFEYLSKELERAAATLQMERLVLINFFGWAIKSSLCVYNYAKDIPVAKINKKIPRYFSEAELKKIFEESKPPYTNIFKFLYLTGLRIGELCNLQWVHYFDSEKTLLIDVIEGNKPRHAETIPLSEGAIRILNEQFESNKNEYRFTNDYIFTNAIGEKLDNSNIYRNLKVVLKNKKISGGHPHTLRHTFASHLVNKKVSLYVVKELMRHKSIVETEIYAHLDKDVTREATNILSI